MIKKCRIINNVKVKGEKLKGRVISVEIPNATDDYIIIGMIEVDGVVIRFPLCPGDLELLPDCLSN
jgi:hypothetical protein